MQDRRDRERALERLLPHALEEASRAGPPGCVDAETLAAWSNGTLRASDAAEVETHLADCAHCQAVLGTFVRSAPPAAVSGGAWTRWHLRWLVPLATAATALTVYLLVPGGDLVRGPDTMVSMSDARREPQPSPAREQERPRMTAPPATASPAAAPEADRLSSERPVPGEPRVPAAPADAMRAPETADRVAVMPQAQAAAKAEPPALMEEKVGAAPPVAGVGAQADERRADAALNLRRPAPPMIEIATPTPTHRYRIVAGVRVERTTTGGQAWETMSRPVGGEMTAGAAPTIDVCWIVGRGGGVWRTTDGQPFVRISFPQPIDLVGVTAESATVAIVTAADGRAFRTDDGGLTWR